MRRILPLVLLALLVGACGGGGDPTVEPSPTGGATEAGTLTGVFDGDAQLEGGCVWLETTGGPDADVGERVEPIFPEGYQVEFAPDLRLLDPAGAVVAERGTELVVEGQPAEDRASICQVGPLYQVDEVLGTVGG